MKSSANMTLDSRSLSSCFNVHNIEHLKAYKYLQETGRWPKNMSFVFPKNMFITSHCIPIIRDRLAYAWVEHKIDIESAPIPTEK